MENYANDTEVVQIEQKIPTLMDKANSLKITDELSSKVANDVGVTLKKMIRALDDKRKYYVGPSNETIKRINNSFNEKILALKEAYEIVREKLQTYIIDLRKKEDAERAEKNKKASEFLGSEEPAPMQSPPPPTHVTSQFGKSYTQKRWTFKEVDIEKVPREYLLLNEKKVNAMIKAHTKTVKGVSKCDLKIDGLEIFQDEKLGMRG